MERTWIARMGRPLLIGALTTMVAVVMLPVLLGGIPSGHDFSLPFFCGFITLEAMVSAELLRSERAPTLTPVRVRLAEIVSLAICRQVWVPLFGGTSLLWAGFPRLQLGAVLLAVLAVLPMAGAWLIGARMASTYRALDTGGWRVGDAPAPSAALGLWVLAGGMVVVGGDLLARVHGASESSVHDGLPLSWVILLYAIVAVIVLSEIRYSSLRPPRRMVSTPVAPDFNRAWLRYGSVFVASSLALALLLPYAWPGSAVRSPFGEAHQLLAGLGRLRPIQPAHAPGSPAYTGSPPVPPQHTERETVRSRPRSTPSYVGPARTVVLLPLDGVRSLLELGLPWLIVAASVLYRVRRRRSRELGAMPISGYLAELVGGCVRGILSLARLLIRRPPRFWQRFAVLSARGTRPTSRVARRRIRLPARRTPGERVVAAYTSVVRRAERERVLRSAGYSPREVVQIVGDVAAERQQDMAEVAERYVEARYSRHEIDPDAARHTEKVAGRIRRAIAHRVTT